MSRRTGKEESAFGHNLPVGSTGGDECSVVLRDSVGGGGSRLAVVR